MFNQHENFQGAILKKRARVEEINLILNRPLPKGASHGGRLRLIEEKLHLEKAISELEAEDARLVAQKVQQRIFRWEDLDQRLVTPKTSDLADEMQKRIVDAARQISSDCNKRHNMGGYLPGLSDFHEKLTDEWAGRLYEAYCEARKQQKEEITPGFIRAVRDIAVRKFIDVRTSSVSESFSNWSRRTGGLYFNPHVLSNWNMKMMRLWDRWNRRLEGEAVAAEYAAKHSEKANPPTNSMMPPSKPKGVAGIWHDFHDQFVALFREEQAVSPGNIGDKWLRVHVSYENPAAKFGEYWPTRGIGESFSTRFDALATRAGIALSIARNEAKPLNIWLHHVFQDLLEQRSKLLSAESSEGGIINHLCEASAIYCARLEVKALESEAARQPSFKTKPGRAPRLPDGFVTLAGKLWKRSLNIAGTKVSEASLQEIGDQLDRAGYTPPAEYLEGQYSSDLKTFNSHHSNSNNGPIKTWARMVANGDKDQLRGMRRLLSRCASK